MGMTKKSFFHLLMRTSKSGGFPSRNTRPQVSCAYRSKDGKKCAVGLIIPDKDYDPSFDKGMMTSDQLFDAHPELAKHIPLGLDMHDMYQIQQCHDRQGLHKGGKWDHEWFVSDLTSLECFSEFAK